MITYSVFKVGLNVTSTADGNETFFITYFWLPS